MIIVVVVVVVVVVVFFFNLLGHSKELSKAFSFISRKPCTILLFRKSYVTLCRYWNKKTNSGLSVSHIKSSR